MTTITSKVALSAIIEAGISPEVTAWAEGQLAGLERKAAAKATKAHEKAAAEATPILAAIREVLAEAGGAMTASAVGAAVGVSTQKASAMLRKLAAEGAVEVSEVKGKSGKVKGYALVGADEGEEVDDIA